MQHFVFDESYDCQMTAAKLSTSGLRVTQPSFDVGDFSAMIGVSKKIPETAYAPVVVAQALSTPVSRATAEKGAIIHVICGLAGRHPSSNVLGRNGHRRPRFGPDC
jgi:hypothetical protein